MPHVVLLCILLYSTLLYSTLKLTGIRYLGRKTLCFISINSGEPRYHPGLFPNPQTFQEFQEIGGSPGKHPCPQQTICTYRQGSLFAFFWGGCFFLLCTSPEKDFDFLPQSAMLAAIVPPPWGRATPGPLCGTDFSVA